MQGGDTDTNGSIAGAMLGAKLGVDAIPQRWLARVPRGNYISELAERLRSLDAAGESG